MSNDELVWVYDNELVLRLRNVKNLNDDVGCQLPVALHSISAHRPQVTGNQVLAASAADYRISQYTL